MSIPPVTFMFGTQCRVKDHLLISLEMENIFQLVKEGNDGLIEQTKILRSVLKMDINRYRIMKTSLPFFTCSIFDPAIRRKENFKCAIGLILDIDWKTQFDRKKYQQLIIDPRIVFAYTSPSGLGTKLVFLFNEPLTDVYDYTDYYKNFTRKFGSAYGIMDVLDFRNSDVSRISFLSYDPESFINEDFIPLDWRSEMPDREMLPSPKENDELSPDVYRTILNKLNSRPKIKRSEMPISENIIEKTAIFNQILEPYGLWIKEMTGIAYGTKVKITDGKNFGEVNIYFGKKGFSVIVSPKRGTEITLSELCQKLIQEVI